MEAEGASTRACSLSQCLIVGADTSVYGTNDEGDGDGEGESSDLLG